MKRLVLVFVLLIGINTTFAQESEKNASFPYGKMLKMSPDELLAAKFKYDANKNQYVLQKLNGMNQTASILGALNGTPQAYVPHVDDYRVLIQGGESGYSFIDVTFYDGNVYDKIYEFATTKGQNLTETGTGNLKFVYDNYSFTLTSVRVGQSSANAKNGVAVSRDQSYMVYSFAIYTGIPVQSKWHTKQALKEMKRDAAGKKKKSAADLM